MVGRLGLARTAVAGARRRAEDGAAQERDERGREFLARADRLAVLGTLAAGIAHDIRNPLVSVRTFIELLPERLHDEEFRTEFRQLALTEIERVCALLNDLLAFVHPPAIRPESSDPSLLASQTIRLLEPEARQRGVTLEARCARDTRLVPVDEGRLKQVLMNVILNAIEACGERGTVWVATRTEREGGWSTIEIADSGVGI